MILWLLLSLPEKAHVFPWQEGNSEHLQQAINQMKLLEPHLLEQAVGKEPNHLVNLTAGEFKTTRKVDFDANSNNYSVYFQSLFLLGWFHEIFTPSWNIMNGID